MRTDMDSIGKRPSLDHHFWTSQLFGCAKCGFGKTTLLAEVVAVAQVQVQTIRRLTFDHENLPIAPDRGNMAVESRVSSYIYQERLVDPIENCHVTYSRRPFVSISLQATWYELCPMATLPPKPSIKRDACYHLESNKAWLAG